MSNEPKEMLDMTTEEAMEFMFPVEVIDELKKTANPENAKVSEPDETDCED